MNKSLKQSEKDIFDVFVLGGGIAGISAALSASRQGKKVILCEKNFILGGLATSGLVAYYLPLCDGNGNQVVYGIAEELLKLSVKYWHDNSVSYIEWIQNESKNRNKTSRYMVEFNPSLFSLSLEELLINSGVKILYGSLLVGCEVFKDKIKSVIIENKSGRSYIEAKTFIDASGDCDLAYYSKTPTVLFKQGNVLASWYYYMEKGQNKLNTLGVCDIPDDEKKEGKEVDLLSNRRFSGVEGNELSEMVILSHKEIYKDALKHLKNDSNSVILSIPTIPQVRMTRRIDGEFTLTKDNSDSCFENSIGVVSNWKMSGAIYEVPFDILHNKTMKNLICAGRCVSNDDYMWDIMRVIPCCAVTGEAAGIAASISDDFSSIDIFELQKILHEKGVIIHKNEVLNKSINNKIV